jgi:putative transposase
VQQSAPHGKEAKMFDSFRSSVVQARRHGDLYFAALLDRETIIEALGEASSLWQGWIYTPAVTCWTFLSQCLSPDHSCREAVVRLAAWRTTQGLAPCSTETGAYCTARNALPEAACRELARRTGREVEAQAPTEWLWRGRRVRVVDGSTITMPDTLENQAEYPQAKTQQPGCGLPIARIVVVFSLAVGTVLEAAIGPYAGKQTGENSLLRSLHDALIPGDVVLGDRCFSGWFDVALLHQRGVDVVVRKHQLRPTDFRTGVRLGADDHVVGVSKPQRPAWMSPASYATLPEELRLREVRVRVKQRGFRTRILIVVTTLLDAQEHPPGEIAELYRRRWQAELHLRTLKVVLQLDHLRCKTPQRVRKELFMHLTAYNLVRRAMTLTALERDRRPWQISFKAALQALGAYLPLLGAAMPIDAGCRALVQGIAAHRIGHRPDRCEPRRIKRRPKSHDLLMKPRSQYKRTAA